MIYMAGSENCLNQKRPESTLIDPGERCSHGRVSMGYPRLNTLINLEANILSQYGCMYNINKDVQIKP